MKKNGENIEYECCALCGKITDVPVSLPIEFRDYYIEGFGQLCYNCQYDLGSEQE